MDPLQTDATMYLAQFQSMFPASIQTVICRYQALGCGLTKSFLDSVQLQSELKNYTSPKHLFFSSSADCLSSLPHLKLATCGSILRPVILSQVTGQPTAANSNKTNHLASSNFPIKLISSNRPNVSLLIGTRSRRCAFSELVGLRGKFNILSIIMYVLSEAGYP